MLVLIIKNGLRNFSVEVMERFGFWLASMSLTSSQQGLQFYLIGSARLELCLKISQDQGLRVK
jgi:hypothetical protein